MAEIHLIKLWPQSAVWDRGKTRCNRSLIRWTRTRLILGIFHGRAFDTCTAVQGNVASNRRPPTLFTPSWDQQQYWSYNNPQFLSLPPSSLSHYPELNCPHHYLKTCGAQLSYQQEAPVKHDRLSPARRPPSSHFNTNPWIAKRFPAIVTYLLTIPMLYPVFRAQIKAMVVMCNSLSIGDAKPKFRL